MAQESFVARRYPTSSWPTGIQIRDAHTVTLPGIYQIAIGMYREGSNERLPAFSVEGTPLGDHFLTEALAIR